MQNLFNGRVGLVTGAESGIGQASAALFAARGAKVVIAEFDAAKGAASAEAIWSNGGEASFVQADAADEDSVRAMIDFMIEPYGRLDLAHNHVGHSGPHGSLIDNSVADLERCHRLNTPLLLSWHEVRDPADARNWRASNREHGFARQPDRPMRFSRA